ncbi:hypothetical protein [Enterobacter mori]|uniref:hypothetical protein n=1 Tax=Enterobacter mori TaxID=539813 RepID=UPI001B8D6BEC|nr:hypothetical protein [Enterobacter mori]MBS3047340.1 hypothetical protein [Enterobacter mori]
MDIEINSPINIILDVVELDENIPSIKFSVTIRIRKLCYSCEVNSQFWIVCQEFDRFIDNMKRGDVAILKDMNHFFELRVFSSQGWLEWSCGKEDLEGNVTAFQGKEKLTEESTRTIYEAFNDYPKWW